MGSATSIRNTLAASIALLAFACQAPVVVASPPCDLSSECEAPLICREGRCQTECVSQLDCMLGTHCAETTDMGQCFSDVPLDLASAPCGDTRACEDPMQTCRDHTCWNPCTTSGDCLPDSICHRGVCANPRSQGFGYGVRVMCTSAAQCATGEICASDHGAQRACRRPCEADDDCADIELTPICATIDDPMQPAATMACVIGCDPVRQTGCILTDRCEVTSAAGPTGTATFLDCRAPTGMTIRGATCGTTTPMLGSCDAALGCAPAMADMSGGYECRKFCRVDADCHDATQACTGPRIAGIENTDVVVFGEFHMCEAM